MMIKSTRSLIANNSALAKVSPEVKIKTSSQNIGEWKREVTPHVSASVRCKTWTDGRTDGTISRETETTKVTLRSVGI